MPEPAGYVRVASADEIEEGEIVSFEVDEDERILTKVKGRVCALGGICTHEEAELADGEVEDETLWCPLHSSGFNVFTGEATNLPAVLPLPVYDVKIEDGDVYVAVEPKSQS